MPNPLISAYRAAAETPSDINEHVSCLRRLAEQCEHVTEFGVRYGVSTSAILAGSIHGRLKRLVSYDIVRTGSVDKLEGIARELWTFIESSSTAQVIEPTDLLFIDTQHTREQLAHELSMNSRQVRRWIVIHDTVLFGESGEGSPEGLLPAIRDFLIENDKWFVSEHYPNNNGLTILSCNRPQDCYGDIQL